MHTVDGNPVLWRSRRQDRTAQSSCEAELYSAASASKDAIFLDRLVKSLRPHHDRAAPVLHMDNKSAIQSAINAQDNERQRHIDLRAHFLRDVVTREGLRLECVPGTDNPSDAMTKSLGETLFTKYRTRGHLCPPATTKYTTAA